MKSPEAEQLKNRILQVEYLKVEFSKFEGLCFKGYSPLNDCFKGPYLENTLL